MRKFVVTTSLLLAATLPAFSQSTPQEKYLQSGQKAFDAGQFRSAANSWLKALPSIEAANTPVVLARTLTKIAAAMQGQAKAADANQYLQRALTIYQTLGGITPDFAKVFTDVSQAARNINLAVLGAPSSNTLKANNATVLMTKADSGAKVRIDIPARFESNLNSDKIDQLGLEKLVTFDVSKDPSGNTTVSNIKGFKIHSVEKGMWVNLLNLIVRQPAPSGKYAAEITAGKAGIEKVVQSELPPSVVEPIFGIAKEMDALSAPVTLPLPVVATLDQQPPTDQSPPTVASPTTPPTDQSPPTATSPTTPPTDQSPPTATSPTTPPTDQSPPTPQQPAVGADLPVRPQHAPETTPTAEPSQPEASPPSSDRPSTDPPKNQKSKANNDDDDDDKDKDRDKDKKDKDDKDDDDDKSSKEDDHLIFHMIGKGLHKIRGK